MIKMTIENNKSATERFFTKPLIVVLFATFCCALWGSATPMIKLGYAVMFEGGKPDVPSTILFAGIRFFIAGLMTVVIYSIARRRVLLPKRENLGRIALVSAFQTVIQYFFFYVGLANTTGAKGTIISGSSSFFAIFFSALLFKTEKLTVRKVLACVIGFANIIIINLNGLDLTLNFTGDFFVLFSAMSLAVSSVLMKIFSKHEDAVVISGYQFILGGAVMVAVGFALGGRVDISSFSGIAILLYLAMLSAVAYALWGILLRYNPVSNVTIFSFMTPVFGVILTALILPEASEIQPVNLVLALLLVCLGVFLVNFNFKSRKSKELR